MFSSEIDILLKQGISAHRDGDLSQAQVCYNTILKEQPNHPDANHNLGVLAVGANKAELALPLFKRALEANPSIPQFWVSIVDALLHLKRSEDARRILAQAKERGIQHVKLETQLKQIEELEVDTQTEKFGAMDQRRLGQSNVKDIPKTKLTAIVEMYKKRHFDKALQEINTLVKTYPHSPALHNLGAACCNGKGDYQDAIRHCQCSIKLDPSNPEAHNNLGIAAEGMSLLQQAISHYSKAIEIDETFADAYNNLANTYFKLRMFKQAILYYEKAISYNHKLTSAYYGLGNSFKEIGQALSSIKNYHRAIRSNPSLIEPYANAANLLASINKISFARKYFEKVLEIKPFMAEVHYNLSTLTKYTRSSSHLEQIRQCLKRSDLTRQDICQLKFALGKAHDDFNDITAAFQYFNEANSIRKSLLNYHFETDLSFFKRLITLQESIEAGKLDVSKKSRSGKVPIFIVGMPRSGTTLTEQIISCHPEIFGAGELPYIELYIRNLISNSSEISNSDMLKFRKYYLQSLKQLPTQKKYISDKMPLNFRFIPFIRAALPEAKIIHISRGRIATCWSNYRHYFSTEGLGYSYDLGDLANYYYLYRKLMLRWDKYYPAEIIELEYENLVDRREVETRSLLRKLDIPWNDACLMPEKNKRLVRTASTLQVRSAVRKSDNWRKYKSMIENNLVTTLRTNFI
jgi:tetratricopeptide (TPR) repeat protein